MIVFEPEGGFSLFLANAFIVVLSSWDYISVILAFHFMMGLILQESNWHLFSLNHVGCGSKTENHSCELNVTEQKTIVNTYDYNNNSWGG